MFRVGVDIVEIARVAKNLQNEAFLKRVYAPSELAKYPSPYGEKSMAARFCAKEALIKVFGVAVPLNDIAVLNDAAGRPYYVLSGKAEATRAALGLKELDISLSHSEEYAIAYALGVGDDERKDVPCD